jgi:hypothetical protein
MNGVACAPAAPKNGLASDETAEKRGPDRRESASDGPGVSPAESKHIPFIS